MKDKIMITNVLSYSDGVRLSYLLVGKNKLVENTKFKGFTELASYFNNQDVFEKINLDLIGKTLEAEFVPKQDYKNPLKSTLVLKSIIDNGNTIDLL